MSCGFVSVSLPNDPNSEIDMTKLMEDLEEVDDYGRIADSIGAFWFTGCGDRYLDATAAHHYNDEDTKLAILDALAASCGKECIIRWLAVGEQYGLLHNKVWNTSDLPT